MVTRSVEASVGPKTLANVDRYFRNSFEAVLQELLQNARRAGASKVDVTFDTAAGEVIVADDGAGLPSDQAPLLLTFGGSGNDGVVEGDEAPAGMGFFSLARKGARVRSRDWEMEVPPEAFTGGVPAALRDGLPERRGMTVTFPEPQVVAGTGRVEFLRLQAVELAATMPFLCTVEGEPVARRTPMDRLRDLLGQAREEGLAADVAEAIVDDCQVVVARAELTHVMIRDFDGGLDTDVGARVLVDVFGQVVRLGDADERFLAGLEHGLPYETPVHVSRDGEWCWALPVYLVVLHALGSRVLVPRLPDRTSLVRTEGLVAIRDVVRSLVVRLAGRAPRHSATPLLQSIAGDALGPPQMIVRRPQATSAGHFESLVAVRDDGSLPSEGGDPMVVLSCPNAIVESNVARSRDLSRRGSAMRSVLATTVLDDPGACPHDLVRSVDLQVDGVWYCLMRHGDAVNPYLLQELTGVEDPDGGACILPVGTLRLRVVTRDGRVITQALDYAVVDEGTGSLLVTGQADPVLASQASTWIAYGRRIGEPDARAHLDAMRESVTRQVKGPAGIVASRLADVLVQAPPFDATRVELVRSADGHAWDVAVTLRDGTVSRETLGGLRS